MWYLGLLEAIACRQSLSPPEREVLYRDMINEDASDAHAMVRGETCAMVLFLLLLRVSQAQL